ncbi:MAG: alpha,alpha-trehalase TreF [Chitinophagaceae bacterium]|nr:alpha,alpha-trehalase TreF [Chitinophagaceae bacterium]
MQADSITTININDRLLYIEDFEELFTDVQLRRLLADQKTFTDSIPKFLTDEILNRYRKEKVKEGFRLESFLKLNFELPEETPSVFRSNTSDSVEVHINKLWDVLTIHPVKSGGTLIPLPHRFVIPGGRFREVFYWDSYFTLLGLQAAGRIDLVECMINNFAYLLDRFGFIPNGNRTYFLSRSQPPFFSMMVELLSEEKGEAVFVNYLHQMEKEYRFWMDGDGELLDGNRSNRRVVLMPEGEVLNRYWDSLNTPRPEGYAEDVETAEKAGGGDPEIFRHLRAGAESGWDFSSRWLKDGMNLHSIHTTGIVPVDLNCLLLHLEKSLGRTFLLIHNRAMSQYYYHKAEQRTAAIHKYLWNEGIKMFVDYDHQSNKPTGCATAATVYPLALRIAAQNQAGEVARQIDSKFLQPGGLLTTEVHSGQQWDAPNGWAPLQWMGYKGLLNYDYGSLAKKIKNNWMGNVERIFKTTGKLTEKYDVVNGAKSAGGGEYPNQDGFGWTNGVYLKLKSGK